MANNFNVSGIVKLVDDFSAKARNIAASTQGMMSRFDNLSQKARSLKTVMAGVAASIAAGFSVNKMKDFLGDAAAEDIMNVKFEQMFSKFKDIIQVGRADIEQEMARLGKLGGFDVDDLTGSVAAPLLRGGRVAGQNFMRGMRVAVNMAAITGNTPEALQAAGAKISSMLVNVRRGVMMGQREGLFTPEEAKRLSEMVKSDANIPAVQNAILQAFEKQYDGAAEKTAELASRTMAVLNIGSGEVASGIGHLINSLLGPWLRDIGQAAADVGNTMADIAKEMDGVSGFAARFGILSSKVSELGVSSKALLVALAAIASIIVVAIGALVFAVVGVPGLIIAGIAAAATAIFVFFEDIKNFVISVCQTIAGAVSSAIKPAVDWLGSAFSWIRDTVSSVYNFIANIVSSMRNSLGSAWDDFKDDSVLDWVSKLGSLLMSSLLGPFNMVRNIISGLGLEKKLSGMGSAIMNFVGIGGEETPKLAPATMSTMPNQAKAAAEAKVQGEVTINVKDPGNNATTSITSTGNVPLNRGQTRSGSYRSTVPSSLAVGR